MSCAAQEGTASFLTRARAYLHIYLALEHMTVARKAKLAEFSIWNYFMRRPPVSHYNNI